MKKLGSILLALVMIFALCIPAFAEETTPTNLTIGTDTTRSYEAYKLLDLTTAHKAGVECGGNHDKDACYTYSYSLNDNFDEILMDLTGAEDAAGVLDYLSAPAEGVQEFANRLYRAIQNADIDPVEIEGNTATIDQGYWLIADVTSNDNEFNANSLVMVNTKGALDLTVTPKTALPSIEKKVEDTNDSTGESKWQDSADRDINDDVAFKLTATLPSNLSSYTTYTLQFHDKLAAGFTLKGTPVVTMYASADDASKELNGTVINDFTAITPLTGYTFALGADVKQINGVTQNTVFVVTYEATLGEDAVIGEAGNLNEVSLVFSNDPYGTSTGKTDDKVIVFTYELVVNKTDGTLPLAGAGFQLYKYDSVSKTYKPYGAPKGEANNTETSFTWRGLDDGQYKLEEVVVPNGYNKMADLEFTVSATHDETSNDPALTNLEGGEVVEGVITGQIVKTVINNTGALLPSTGAEGTMWLIFGGAMLVILAGVFMITRKKMSVFED